MSAGRRKQRSAVHRFDGVRDWRRSLDQHFWLLLRGGVTAEELLRATKASVRKHRSVRSLTLPSPEVLEYARILTHWRTTPPFVDENGMPRVLPMAGPGTSFTGLVRQALPEARPQEVLKELSGHGLLTRRRDGSIELRSSMFVMRRQLRSQFLAYSLMSVSGLLDTCHNNLTNNDATRRLGRFQRTVIAERFDRVDLPEFNAFLHERGGKILEEFDGWLKEQEFKKPTRRKRRVGYVGVGIFGFRTR